MSTSVKTETKRLPQTGDMVEVRKGHIRGTGHVITTSRHGGEWVFAVDGFRGTFGPSHIVRIIEKPPQTLGLDFEL